MRLTKADLITTNQLTLLDRTDCGLRCSACDLLLETEGDFARHFVIPDARYLNLGQCPTAPRFDRTINAPLDALRAAEAIRKDS